MAIIELSKQEIEQILEHDCKEHRVYSQPCPDCWITKNNPNSCVLVQKGFCSICGKVIEDE